MINYRQDNNHKHGSTGFIKLLTVLAVLSQIVLQSVQANTTAKNRNDVYNILSTLNSQLNISDLDIWVNENANNPSVTIGDSVYFTMKASSPVFYTLIHVDAKGTTTLIKPTSTATGDQGSRSLVYPPLVGGCKEYELNERCFDEHYQLVQSEPIGQDAVFLLASQQAIPHEVLSMDESATTQYTTRSIRKKVNNVAKGTEESLVFNNINFAFNSSELTIPGRVELDGLGSALVGMQEQLGEIPVVELTGHTDSIGDEAYNDTLSKQRAESAKQYLVSEHGLPIDAIQIAWKGETEPMDTNDTKSGRALNRRVVLKIP